MGEQKRTTSRRGDKPGSDSEQAIPRWTLWEVAGLLISTILVAAPLLSLAYTFVFPPPAPAAPGADTPTPNVTTTGTPPTATPQTPSATPTPPTPTATFTQGSPTATFTPGSPTPTWTAASPTASPTTPSGGGFSVGKAANKDRAVLGEEVVFSIGLSNGGSQDLSIVVSDTPPSRLSVTNISHSCQGTYPNLTVPAASSCQVYLRTIVVETCDCFVVNTVNISGEASGSASSQPVFLSNEATPTPTEGPPPPPTPTGGATVPTLVTPTDTAYPTTQPPSTITPTPLTPSPTPTAGTPTATFTPGSPTATFTPGSPTATFTPVTPTTPPTSGPTLTPSRTPSPGPTVIRPTSQPRPTRKPTTVPVPCNQARIIGETCAAGTTVTISSCCPEWSAQTTADNSGHFEFSALTPGTFTISASGRSRTVTLEGCTSEVRVNLCPVTQVPTTPATPVTISPTVTATAEVTPTAAGPTGTAAPSTGEVTLKLETDRTQVRLGEATTFFLVLQNQSEQAMQNVVIQTAFPNVLGLQGATAAFGTPQVRGQTASLSLDRLAGSRDVRLQVDTFVRLEAEIGTTFTLQGTAKGSEGEAIYSNVLELEIVGEGVPTTQRPEAAPTSSSAGGPEPAPTAGPTETPGGLGQEIPYTGTGLPMAGVMLGGVVLLARQLRLRRSDHRMEKH